VDKRLEVKEYLVKAKYSATPPSPFLNRPASTRTTSPSRWPACPSTWRAVRRCSSSRGPPVSANHIGVCFGGWGVVLVVCVCVSGVLFCLCVCVTCFSCYNNRDSARCSWLSVCFVCHTPYTVDNGHIV